MIRTANIGFPALHRVACVVFVASVAGTCRAEEFQLVRFDLPNGVHVVIGEVADAARQSTFTFLPLTMANDDANRAQWSHLLEHMLIRATDPTTLNTSGMRLNGETTHMYQRLETIAEPEKWKESLARHAQWIAARNLADNVLQREKGSIQGEEDSTAKFGYTSKFASAAWNQIANHGLKQAAVHGDIAGAKLDDVQKYAADHILVNDSMTIASIGPKPAAEVRAEIERLFAGMKNERAKPQAAGGPAAAGALHGTWDLPTTHVMWWWKLPNRDINTLVAATCISRAVQASFMMNPDRKKLVRMIVAYPCIDTLQGPVMLVDCCISIEGAAPAVKPEEVLREIKDLLAKLKSGDAGMTPQFLVNMILQEMHPDSNFPAFRKELPPAMRNMAEGVWLLSQMNYEYFWRAPIEQVVAALRKPDEAAMKTMLEIVNGDPLGSLLLEPKSLAASPQAPMSQPTGSPSKP